MSNQILWGVVRYALFLFSLASCSCITSEVGAQESVVVGAARFEVYEPWLKGKRVGVVCNHTARVGERLLFDTLRARGVEVVRLFTPEHGLEGMADAGERVQSTASRAQLPEVVSLYDHNKRPPLEKVQDLDIILFDLQDVGVRCYTYISTLQYVMEACAQAKKQLVVLDRPNPNGHFVDGPLLQLKYKSFVGMHPVPWIHGMTIGEFARMIVGEGWLPRGAKLKLEVVPCLNYTHTTAYIPPIPPSPNLPNYRAILLYPSLAFFEGTTQSVGRGTDHPFQCVGSPKNPPVGGQNVAKDPRWFSFVPESRLGAKKPPYKGQTCYGLDLSSLHTDSLYRRAKIDLTYLQTMLRFAQGTFFIKFFDQLAGTPQLRTDIQAGKSETEIRAGWQPALTAFQKTRKKYLLYPDFE